MAIFEPPPSYVDLLADAEDTPERGQFRNLQIPGVGVVSARKPMPRSAAALAMSFHATLDPDRANAELDAQGRKSALERQQSRYRDQFIRDHLADGEFDRLMVDMLDPDRDLPTDTTWRLVRCIATWGTARPFGAVVGLTVQAAHNWRVLRYKIQTDGIADPMTLPSLHRVLDTIEALALESFDPDDKGRMERDQFIDHLYRPDPPMTVPGVEDHTALAAPVPAGFEPAATFNSFAVLARATAR